MLNISLHTRFPSSAAPAQRRSNYYKYVRFTVEFPYYYMGIPAAWRNCGSRADAAGGTTWRPLDLLWGGKCLTGW